MKRNQRMEKKKKRKENISHSHDLYSIGYPMHVFELDLSDLDSGDQSCHGWNGRGKGWKENRIQRTKNKHQHKHNTEHAGDTLPPPRRPWSISLLPEVCQSLGGGFFQLILVDPQVVLRTVSFPAHKVLVSVAPACPRPLLAE